MLRQLAISLLLASLVLPATARTRPHYGGTLRVELEGDPWQGPNSLARRLILDGLTVIGPDGAAQPSLAVRWTSENNNHRWQFWLRPGVHFSDASPLTANIVVTSLASTCGTACPWTALRAVGSSLVFTTDAPTPNLPDLLAGDDFLIRLPADPPSGLVGTGPFQQNGALVANGIQTYIDNDNCWAGRPFLDAIEVHSHRSIHDQWLDLIAGRADLVEVPAEQLRQAQQQRLTVTSTPPISLLALAGADSGTLGNPNLRTAIALAVDRAALSNVIFQRQGEITASLLPASLTGYAFLFPADRDLNHARELRGGLTPPTLTLTADPSPTMQLAAQRLALNLRDAGFNVQVSATGTQHSDLALLRLTLPSSQPQPALAGLFHAVGASVPLLDPDPAALYKAEHDFLDSHTLIPLLYLPRAWAVGSRLRDLRLTPAGLPILADASLQDAP